MEEVEIPVGRVVRYGTAKYDFRTWACAVLGTDDLASLHQTLPEIDRAALDGARRKAVTALNEHFHEIRPTFQAFVRDVAAAVLGPLVSWQEPPIFRVQFHGMGSISKMHKDRDYSSSPADSPVLLRNRNVWVPLVRVWDGNSLWIESAEDGGHFIPVALDYGEALIFDGLNVTHGSRENFTGSTRVSFEFRCLPVERHKLSSWYGRYQRTGLRHGDRPPARGPLLEIADGPVVLLDGKRLSGVRYDAHGSKLTWNSPDNSTAGELRFRYFADPERGGQTRRVFYGSLQLATGQPPLVFTGESDPAASRTTSA